MHKGLRELFERGQTAKVRADLKARCLRRLDALDAAMAAEEMDLPGFDFHRLHGQPQRYSVHVNGPFCITFEFAAGDAFRVNLENYH